MEKDYDLIGIINFTSPGKQTRQSTDVGHYTATCYRNNNKWIKYDDCKDCDRTDFKYILRCLPTAYIICNII